MKKYAHLSLMLSVFILFSCSSDDPADNGTDDVDSSDVQEIVINAEDYKHKFEGGGVSIGLFLGHHYSLSAASQDLAIQYMAKDLNMKYFQDYIEIYPEDDPAYFDRRADYVKAAKIYQPDLEFSLVGQKFPADLMVDKNINGQVFQVLDTDDPNIYDRVAMWYFRLLQGFHVRGVTTEILNVVNEPDLDRPFRVQHYGLNGNTLEGVARIFDQAVPKFKELINDPSVNTTGMPMPLIMGPSSISTIGCVEYLQYMKNNYPNAWNQIDIVATHQYENGAIADLFADIVVEAEGKPIYQSETHALKGDFIESGTKTRPHEAALSMANLFSTAVNGGVSSWWYFENNYPNDFHPGGLMQIAFNGAEPVRYKHYYVFQQLTSMQPALSNVITTNAAYNFQSQTIAFRKENENEVYITYSNYTGEDRTIDLIVEDASGNPINIAGYEWIVTDEERNGANIASESFSTPVQDIEIITGEYSVNTFKVSLSD
jgi:hypothetical protein